MLEAFSLINLSLNFGNSASKFEKKFAGFDDIQIIHYSCEKIGQSKGFPRISAISIMNYRSKEQKTFSIHYENSKLNRAKKRLSILEIESAEKNLLHSFFNFLKKQKNCIWLHWNMTDSNFGFEALEARAKSIGLKPCHIPIEFRYNLKENIGGNSKNLKEFIGYHDTQILDGITEANFYKTQHFFQIHDSCERKVKGIWKKLNEQPKDKPISKNLIWVTAVAFLIFCGESVAESEVVTTWNNWKKEFEVNQQKVDQTISEKSLPLDSLKLNLRVGFTNAK